MYTHETNGQNTFLFDINKAGIQLWLKEIVEHFIEAKTLQGIKTVLKGMWLKIIYYGICIYVLYNY